MFDAHVRGFVRRRKRVERRTGHSCNRREGYITADLTSRAVSTTVECRTDVMPRQLEPWRSVYDSRLKFKFNPVMMRYAGVLIAESADWHER